MSWESSDGLDTTLYRVSESSKDSSSDISQTLYGVDESGSITRAKKDVTNILPNTSNIQSKGGDITSIQPKDENSISIEPQSPPFDTPGGGGCYKRCKAFVCESYNLECIAQLIFSGIVALGSCIAYPTFDITKSSCLVCLGSLGITGNTPFTCPIGDNCRTRYLCVSQDEFARGRGGNDNGCL
jgi:hypothetical protein